MPNIGLVPAPGDLRAVRESGQRAYLAAEAADDVDGMAAALLSLAGLWVYEERGAVRSAVMHERLHRLLGRLEPGSPLAARLRVRLAAEADFAASTHTAALAAVDAMPAPGAPGDDPVARFEALHLVHQCVLGPGHGPLRRDLTSRLLADSVRTARPGDMLLGLLWRTVDAFLDGDLHAERFLAELRSTVERERHLAAEYVLAGIDVMLAVRAGRLEDAERRALAAARFGEQIGDPRATGWLGAQLVTIRAFQDRLPELLPMLQDLVHSPTLSPADNSYFAAIAGAAAQSGHRDLAVSALARLGAPGPGLAALPRGGTWLITMHGAVEAAYHLGDGETAATAYDLLTPFADRPMLASLAVACFGSAHQALGTAALTLGQKERAAEHFAAAVQQNLALGHWPAVAVARRRFAEATGGTAAGAPPGPALCEMQNRSWKVSLGERAVEVDHRVGMLYLAVLLANPGTQILAVELAAGVNGVRAAEPGLSAQPVLDRAAYQRYRRELHRLDSRIAELADGGDPTAAERVREEREWLLAELAGSTGLGGRARAFSDNAERARVAVGRAIRRAIALIHNRDPLIGTHLSNCIRTGLHCSYDYPRFRPPA